MTRVRTHAEAAAGTVISAVQKAWTYRIGTDQASTAESVMNRAHELLQAIKRDDLTSVLAGQSICDFLGTEWAACHPAVDEAVKTLECVTNEV